MKRRGIALKLNVHCCLIFEKKQPKIPYTCTGIANLFSKRRSYLDAAPACSTDAFLLSQLHRLKKVVSGFMIDPQMDYKHEHSLSLTIFLKFYCEETTYSLFEDK